ncbi:hypothetical protein C1645_873566 [Glomus cerebriforme]|uniref:F-box domain-containing protein n=1 Tax=Glomus cerebriforme TaxID=658196 RepID=A0A397TD47_9GLOM|nr:hypothetical protein C1645_873566 [Glomus cerebriforme]
MSQLPVECLSEIFEYLEEDKDTLRSCLLVNRLWCRVSVRILWRDIWNYKTLITSLPNESKNFLHENGISISSKPPLFNYASFCKFLSVDDVNFEIRRHLKQQRKSISPQNLNDNTYIVLQEILKLFMSQISCLNKLFIDSQLEQSSIFISYPGTRVCLKNLSELHCFSDVYPPFFNQLSQISHNIQLLDISFDKIISNGLTNLISAQQNLKYLEMYQYDDCDLTDIITSLIKHNLIKLYIYGGRRYIPLYFIAKFTNLQELILSFFKSDAFEDFKKLHRINFSQLNSLEFKHECPKNESLIRFLEINGRNLRNFFINKSDDSLNSAIIKFCPNLRRLFTGLKIDEFRTVKMFFNNCRYLESIRINCYGCFSEKKLFEIVANYSPKNFNELVLHHSYNARSGLIPNDLESFFVSWTNRISQQPLSLIIIGEDVHSFKNNWENQKIIERYIRLGIIKSL